MKNHSYKTHEEAVVDEKILLASSGEKEVIIIFSFL